MVTLKKYWWIILPLLGLIGNEMRKAYVEGGDAVRLEQRIYPTMELRNKSLENLKTILTPKQKAKKELRDSLSAVMNIKNKEDAIKSRAQRDSLAILQFKRDSIKAVNDWQMKEAVEQIQRVLKIKTINN